MNTHVCVYDFDCIYTRVSVGMHAYIYIYMCVNVICLKKDLNDLPKNTLILRKQNFF